MEYIFKTNIQRGGNSFSVIRKVLLSAMALVLILCLSFWYNGIQKDPLTGQVVQEERINKTDDQEMSAVKFTTLPFILAFKHFIVDREE